MTHIAVYLSGVAFGYFLIWLYIRVQKWWQSRPNASTPSLTRKRRIMSWWRPQDLAEGRKVLVIGSPPFFGKIRVRLRAYLLPAFLARRDGLVARDEAGNVETIPPDAVIYRARTDGDDIELMVKHDSFPVIMPGEHIPLLALEEAKKQ